MQPVCIAFFVSTHMLDTVHYIRLCLPYISGTQQM